MTESTGFTAAEGSSSMSETTVSPVRRPLLPGEPLPTWWPIRA
ncbi:hypothetical protein [Mycolicibacterium gadium]|nr:hypothetical protein [Mycolicibacterium gadium]